LTTAIVSGFNLLATSGVSAAIVNLLCLPIRRIIVRARASGISISACGLYGVWTAAGA
jgi:hypothetical protein